MQVSTFNFNFIFTSSKLNAICHKMRVHQYPQIRAAIWETAKEITKKPVGITA